MGGPRGLAAEGGRRQRLGMMGEADGLVLQVLEGEAVGIKSFGYSCRVAWAWMGTTIQTCWWGSLDDTARSSGESSIRIALTLPRAGPCCRARSPASFPA